MVAVRGVAHPPADARRQHAADLSRAEIATTDLAGQPLLWEHNGQERVGTVLASWEGPRGELRMAADVDDPTIAARVRSGSARGLSLGTDLVQNVDGDTIYRGQRELSVCEEPRRAGCYIDTVDGRSVLQRVNASAGSTFVGSNARFAST